MRRVSGSLGFHPRLSHTSFGGLSQSFRLNPLSWGDDIVVRSILGRLQGGGKEDHHYELRGSAAERTLHRDLACFGHGALGICLCSGYQRNRGVSLVGLD